MQIYYVKVSEKLRAMCHIGDWRNQSKDQSERERRDCRKEEGKKRTFKWGSSAAGVACAISSLLNIGGSSFYSLWMLGFVASFATKLSDTVSSEIGKAYGKRT